MLIRSLGICDSLLVIILAVVLVLSLVSGFYGNHQGMAQNEAPNSYTVTIKIGSSIPNMQANPQASYDPPVLPIKSTDKGIPLKSIVTWVNDDDSYHTVTSGDGLTGPNRLFDSGILSPKVNWSYTFNTPGEYSYYCTVHPFMTGLVKVTG